MIKILFVCHGNICRSPMAEFVMKDLVQKAGLKDIVVRSAATSTEEIGNSMHVGTKQILEQHHIPYTDKRAVQLQKSDAQEFDYLIGMETRNINQILKIIGSDYERKVSRLLDFTEVEGNIDDPWYTGDFDITYRMVKKGCEALIERLKKEIG